ncbi:MAG: hypothetical protein AMXMBFR84_31440 [Candidatus Hydrogenedentota bacterium]
MDQNDNFSPDGRFLCYDTREMVGEGIGNGQSIEKVEIATGIETILYKAEKSVIGEKPAPGVGAVTFSFVENKVAFIHGPLLEEVSERGHYDKPNRKGAVIAADGGGKLGWLDFRDVSTDRPTTPGAHRGGTHRHEFCRSDHRVGFTYDDFLCPQFDRTIGYMERRNDAPGGASHWFALLIRPAEKEKAKPGEIEKAYGDSWVDPEGTMRAFIGKVRNADGVTYEESLFVVDVPQTVDITTAKAGNGTDYPTPPKGLTVRRLTHSKAEGVVRGSHQGDRVAYFAYAPNGTKQIFVVRADGSDQDPDPAKRPVQVTHFDGGASGNLRWHPSGNAIICTADNAIAVTVAKPGPSFGRSVLITGSEGPERVKLVVSHDGTLVAYNKAVPTFDGQGNRAKDYLDRDFLQVFTVPYPDSDGDGIPDGIS